MLVEIAPNLVGLIVSAGSESLFLKKGEQVQLTGTLMIRLLAENKLVKAEYPQILNDEVVTIAYNPDRGWRPIGRLEKRP